MLAVIRKWTQLGLSEGDAMGKISYQLSLVYYGRIKVLTRKLAAIIKKDPYLDVLI